MTALDEAAAALAANDMARVEAIVGETLETHDEMVVSCCGPTSS
jgi:hypothetical protein